MADAQPQTAPDTSNIGAIIGGMGLAPARDQTSAPLPDILQPGYQPPQPTSLQPPSAQPPVSLQPPPPAQPAQPAPPQPAPAPPQLQPPTQPQPQVATASQPGPPPPRSNLPWPAANANSPRIDPATAPALPGETPQETADLNRHLGHESGGQNIINNWAKNDPTLYTNRENPRTCQGYWQTVNSTWRDGAQRAGVDLRQFPTALTADYWTQRKVALALYRAYGNEPWKPQPGAGERGDRFALKPQLPLPPEQRGQEDWGHPAQRDFGPGPEGRPFGQAAFMQPGQSGFTRVLNAIGPLLMGIGSLALHLPLSTAITAYGAMAKAQDTGQKEAYDRARTQFQDQLKEANAQQTLESQAASDAFSEYGTNNPEGLQQQLARIALQYNDPVMYRMAEKGDLNGIHQLQTKRDQYNQDLTKLNKANEDARDREAQDAAARGMYQQWHDKFVQENGREPTADEAAIEYNKDLGEAARAGTKDPKAASAGVETPVYDVLDKDGNVIRQVQRDKSGHLLDMNDQPTTIDPTKERLRPVSTKEGTSAGTPAQQTEMDAAKADLDDWVKQQPTPPTDAQKKQKLADFLAKRHEEMQRQPVPRNPGDYDIIDPDQGNKVIERGKNLVPKPGGGWLDQDTKQDWKPPAGSPNARPMRTTPSTTGGGRYGMYNLRVINSGKQVALHLQNAMLLSKGTTVGMFGALGPGVDLTKATTGLLGRHLTSEESTAMQGIMAGMQRELAQAESFGMLPSNKATELQDALIPKPGMTLNDVLLNYAIIRQDVDAIMDTVKLSPYATQEEKDNADQAKADMARAVWWSPADAIHAMRANNPGESYSDVARRMGLGSPPSTTTPATPTQPPSGSGGWGIRPLPPATPPP